MNDFELFWDLFQADSEYLNRRSATYRQWLERTDEDRQAMIADLRQNGAPKHRNPYFYVQDFRRKQPRQQVMSFNDYYTRYGTTEEMDGWRREFIEEQQKTIFVK